MGKRLANDKTFSFSINYYKTNLDGFQICLDNDNEITNQHVTHVTDIIVTNGKNISCQNKSKF